MVLTSFLKKIMGGGTVIEPFSRVLLGGKTKKRTSRKTKGKTRMKKNISRKKVTRRVARSNKRSINKRTNQKKGEKRGVKRTTQTKGKKRGTIKRKTVKKLRYSKKKRQCNCDTSRSYHGNEPSPKGLGFCAHCIPLNVTMKGLDGNLWENQKYTKGKRWVKVRVDMN